MPKKKLLNLLIKIVIAVLLAGAIYMQVFSRQDASSLWQALLQHFTFPNLMWLVMVVFLAPFNLAFESLKWRKLIRSFTRIGFWKTYKAVLSGVTIAIFTPNRVGEYGGRVLFIEPEHNWKAVIATLVGSLAQLLVILSAGLLGLVYFSNNFLRFDWEVLPLVMSLGVVLVGLMVFCFFNIDLLIPVVKRLPYVHFFKRYFKHLLVLKSYSSKELWTALGYAFLRFCTYSLQYYLLLKFYGIPVSLITGMAGITTIFFVQASIPLPPVMGLLARGEIALHIWGFFSEDQVGILAATFTLFVINIAIPALLGLVFIVQINILKSLGYKNGNEG